MTRTKDTKATTKGSKSKSALFVTIATVVRGI